MISPSFIDRAPEFYDHEALLERLTYGVKSMNRSVVFIVGSALTAPMSAGACGVPGVSGVIDIIRTGFDDVQRALLDEKLKDVQNKYQEAFRFLIGRRGQHAANNIIREAVAAARLRPFDTKGVTDYKLSTSTTDEVCRSFDNDFAGWSLTPGVQALGQLAVGYPDTFGRTVLTTNFDPLIGAAVRANGGTTFRTVLHSDGKLGQTDGYGYHVVHLHGYWYGSDTLHTPRQLGQPRPQLKASLSHLIRDKTVVVVGYGGWDDVFTQALMDVVVDDNAFPEVIWTFKDKNPKVNAHLLHLLEPGLNRARVTLYSGIDCHTILPQMVERWGTIQPPVFQQSLVAVSGANGMSGEPVIEAVVDILPFDLDGDRPPQSPFYVGRSQEVASLRGSSFRAGFITGIGGQGKSALAAQFFANADTTGAFDHRVWQDCKEENARFENHLVSIIKILSRGRVAGIDLAKQSMTDLATIFGRLTADCRVLAVFDNIDHYIDLELGVLQGAAGEFLEFFLKSESKARLLFTCRPAIQTHDIDLFSQHLEGIDLAAAVELFRLRKADADTTAIEKIYQMTSGHAFWIDLLAAQFARKPSSHQRDELLESFSIGMGAIPDATLRSIWNNLQERQQVVLQALAETLRPTTLIQLEHYLSSRLRYNQISKALRSLQDLSLVVVKPGRDNLDGFELHPLIRTFIKSTSPRETRLWYIDAILEVYGKFFGAHRGNLSSRPDADTLSYWIEGAELYINAGKYGRAYTQLFEVALSFQISAPPGEFVRVAELLMTKENLLEAAKYTHFDAVFSALIRILSNLGRIERALQLLDEYKATIKGKDARYINLCSLQCHLHWKNADYETAIRWGAEGVELKASSGVDTKYSAEHTLALARRESGDVDAALKVFLGGLSLDEAVDPNHIDRDRGGIFYGNVGRCLHLMGQIEPALRCYQKSAQLIEEDLKDHEENRAYARQWIGELLHLKGDRVAALSFFVAAKAKWSLVSPPSADRMEGTIYSLVEEDKELIIQSDAAAEAFCRRWISVGH